MILRNFWINNYRSETKKLLLNVNKLQKNLLMLQMMDLFSVLIKNLKSYDVRISNSMQNYKYLKILVLRKKKTQSCLKNLENGNKLKRLGSTLNKYEKKEKINISILILVLNQFIFLKIIISVSDTCKNSLDWISIKYFI